MNNIIDTEEPIDKKTITTKQAARMLGVRKTRIRRYVKDGVLKAIKTGQHKQSRLLITLDSINELLEAK